MTICFEFDTGYLPFLSYDYVILDRLPGPPQNVHVDVIDPHSVRVRWDPPVKNPNTVEMYR